MRDVILGKMAGGGMKAKAGTTPDVSYATQMILHHKQAIQLSKMILSKGADPEIKAFAQKVITAQTSEISFLKNWRRKYK